MRTKKQKKKELSDEQLEIVEAKDFFDCTMPGVIRFYTDHYICGNFYKSCWAVTEYPPSTEETAILAHLADRNGVTLRIYDRREKDEQIFSTLNRVDKAISEHGFAARRMSKPEIKRMLALYFGTSISGDDIPDIEGENEFDLEKQEVTVNEK